jgi:hypothetical protein
MKLSVIGCGYLGAVHAAAMASIGHDVVGIDVDERKIAALSKGEAPFFEPGLPEILAEGIASGRLRFTTDMSEAEGAKVHFVGVGTPQVKDGYAADMTYVNAAVDGLIPYLSHGDVVAGKSTVPVGTAAALAERVTPTGATLVWNPEFLREGFAVKDTIDPDRLVAGVPAGDEGDAATAILREVYHPAIDKGTPFIVTDYATAELVKVAANAFLATKISFINAMAEIAEVTGADVTQLADAIGHDARIGRRFLGAGIGFGGPAHRKGSRASMRSHAPPGRGRPRDHRGPRRGSLQNGCDPRLQPGDRAGVLGAAAPHRLPARLTVHEGVLARDGARRIRPRRSRVGHCRRLRRVEAGPRARSACRSGGRGGEGRGGCGGGIRQGHVADTRGAVTGSVRHSAR